MYYLYLYAERSALRDIPHTRQICYDVCRKSFLLPAPDNGLSAIIISQRTFSWFLSKAPSYVCLRQWYRHSADSTPVTFPISWKPRIWDVTVLDIITKLSAAGIHLQKRSTFCIVYNYLWKYEIF